MERNTQDARILFMERLCVDEAIDSPPPLLSCAVRYQNGEIFSHTVGSEHAASLCAESILHTLLAAVCVLLSSVGKCAFSMPITAFLPRFPIHDATLCDLLCGAIPMKLTGAIPQNADTDTVCAHIARCDGYLPFPYTVQNHLLCDILLQIAEMPIEDICEALLFTQLGMESTFFFGKDSLKVRLPYRVETGTTETPHSAFGKLFSNANDLLKLLCALTDAAQGKRVPVFTKKTASVLLTPHRETLATPAFQMRGYGRSAFGFPDFASQTAYLSMREKEVFLFTDTSYGISYAVMSDNTALSRDHSAISRLGNILFSAED